MMDFAFRIVLTILCLGIVVVIHEFGHFLVARWLGVRVERFTVGFGPEIFGWTRGETRYALCMIPLGGMVKLAGEYPEERTQSPDEFFSQPWYRRIYIALAGPVMNYLLAFVLFALVAGVWGVFRPSTEPVVGEILSGLPAAEAHLMLGDRVWKIEGKTVATWEEMAALIHDSPGRRLVLQIERVDVKTGTLKTVPVMLTPKADPQRGVGLIGILPRVDRVRVGLRGSLSAGVTDLETWTLQPLKYLGQKVRRWEGPKELSGPLGIAQMVTKATREGLSYVIYLMAIISTGLGLFNLFPIPILDGGHVFLYSVEGLLRKPLSPRVMQVANAIGLSIVLTIFLYASYQDVLRLHHGFWK